VPLAQVLSEAVEAARAEAGRRGTGVRVELTLGRGSDDGDAGRPLAVSGDRTRLLQIFSNLLNNAVKFSTKGGRVLVSLRAEGGEARVEVSDEGLGIAPEFLPHVFERFRQEDSSTTRAHGGLGLGLALVKSFVEAHGGTVGAESGGADRGARFTVRLPLLGRPAAESGVAAEGPPRGEGKSPARLRVLVVDDAPDTLELLEAVFSSRGFAATLCATADEALGVASSETFDIIVSDIGLPHTDGYELIRQLRQRPHLSAVPAVALTGYAARKDADEALSAGFDVHIPKPVDPTALADTVERLLAEKSRRA
ncbi:MAG TPA: ATP-binding protein, partial [Pyrinomonadaceae bacterium]|nr:ATP-binding protein [Pyrinomonadaceae bacterium]